MTKQILGVECRAFLFYRGFFKCPINGSIKVICIRVKPSLAKARFMRSFSEMKPAWTSINTSGDVMSLPATKFPLRRLLRVRGILASGVWRYDL